MVLAGDRKGFLDGLVKSWIGREIERVAKAQESGDWERAERGLAEILAREPRHAEANYRMACLAYDAGYVEDAFGHINVSYGAHPKDPRYARLMALVRKTLAKPAQSAGDWRQAIHFLDSPALENDAEGLGWLATAHYHLGRMEECRDAYRRKMDLLPPSPLASSQWIGLQAGNPEIDEKGFWEVASGWEAQFGRHDVESSPFPSHAIRTPGRKVRIGFVSPTFYHQANANFLLPLVEHLDRSVFEVFAYHDGRRKDDVTERFAAAVEVFRLIAGLGAGDAAALIGKDEIDLLVDINGHFDESRMEIYAMRPAPVQVHYLGGVGPTGLRSIDWRFADEVTEPEKDAGEGVLGERIFRMKGGIHAYRPLLETAEVPESPSPTDVVRLGCMNALHKMERPVLELWGRILSRHPEARLVLVKEVFRQASAREDFLERAGMCGMPIGQVELKPPGPGMGFDDLSIYREIDLALDTFPYNGITTTCEALWMGVPVVSLIGSRFVAREAAALLIHSGFSDWVADSEEAYLRIVSEAIEQRGQLGMMRKARALAFRSGPCCDAQRLADEWKRFVNL